MEAAAIVPTHGCPLYGRETARWHFYLAIGVCGVSAVSGVHIPFLGNKNAFRLCQEL